MDSNNHAGKTHLYRFSIIIYNSVYMLHTQSILTKFEGSPFRLDRSMDCGGVWEYLAGVLGDTRTGLDMGVTGDATVDEIRETYKTIMCKTARKEIVRD